MIRILFLLSPLFFGGLTLLLGETFQWLRQENRSGGFKTTRVLPGTGRK